MGVIGSESGGYATVTPIQGNPIGDAMQINDQNAQKYRDQLNLATQRKDAKAKAKQEAIDKGIEDDLKDADDVNKIDAKPSGFKGMDSVVKSGLAEIRPEVIENRRLYRQTGDKKYLDASMASMAKLKTIAAVTDSYAEIAKRTQEGVASGAIDDEESDRILNYAKRLENGDIKMSFDKLGNPVFDAYEIDPKTGQLTDHFLKNIPGEELQAELSPSKAFDYTKQRDSDIKGLGEDVENTVGGKIIKGVPNVEKKIIAQVNSSLANDKLVKQLAKYFKIPIDEKTGITPEIKALVGEKYGADLLRAKNTSIKRDYEGERLAETKKENNKTKPSKLKPFKPIVNVVTKGGMSNSLGMNIEKNDAVLIPTYPKGTSGVVKSVVLNKDGVFRFGIADRKNDDLNEAGQKRKDDWDKENPDVDYKATDKDFKYSYSKPTIYTSGKDDHIIEEKVRTMLNPQTGDYFQNFEEYKEVYLPYKPKKSGGSTNKTTQAAKTKKKIGGF
ncbi:MAG TPA: hypothetical protein VIV55_10000 [Flavobacterium sp.]